MDDVKILEEVVESPSHKWLTYLIEVGIIVIALALVLTIRFAFYEPTIVISGSMEPSLAIDDRLIVDHRSGLRHSWQRGDIVMFTAPDTWGASDDYLIKRVVGLPGETLAILHNQVTINGQPVTEAYLKAGSLMQDMNPLTLEAGQYFVMGDNRNNSDDSRANGPVADRFIEGRATYRYWPMGRMGSLSRVNS